MKAKTKTKMMAYSTKLSEPTLSIGQCRKILGKKYDDISDEQIMEFAGIMDTIAELTIKVIYHGNKEKT